MRLPDPLHKSDAKRLVCPWAADQFFNHGAVQVETPEMVSGTWQHRLLQGVYSGELAEDEALSLCEADDEWLILNNALSNDPCRDDECQLELPVAVDASGKYVPMGAAPAYAGRLDRLIPPSLVKGDYRERLCIVQDWKTGWLITSDQNEIDLYGLFGWAWCEAAGFKVDAVQFVYDYCRYGKRIATTMTADYLRELPGILNMRFEQYRQMEPVPIPGQHCQRCQFLGKECPLGLSTEIAFPDPNASSLAIRDALRRFHDTGEMEPSMAPAVGFGIAWLEARVGQLKKALKPWIQENGPIRVGDAEWRIDEQDGDKWDHEAVWKILAESGVPPETLAKTLTITKTTAGRLKKAHPEVYSDVMEYGRMAGEPIQKLAYRKVKE